MQELRANVYGRVQMVMFRDFVQRKARGLKLVGYVHNLADGSVAVVAQGERTALETLVERLHEGSILSKVEKVEVAWGEPAHTFRNFSIRY